MPLSPLLPGFTTPDPTPINSVRFINAAYYAAPGVAAATTYSGLVSCFAAALVNGYGVEFPPGTYTLSQAIKLDGFTKLVITGQGKIVFPSADTSLGTDAVYNSDPANKRSAFYIEDCEDVEISGLTFEGNSAETNILVNMGLAVSAVRTARLRLDNVKQRYGGGLVSQTSLAGDAVGIVTRCYSYGSRLNSRLGDYGEFTDCHFELPTTAGYDRVGDNGSSHGIYHYAASGDYLKVTGCTFLNIRIDGVKVSGSASTMTSFNISNNTFINVGKDSDGGNAGGVGVAIGADDVNQHNQVVINNNTFTDCAGAIQVYGSRSVSVQNNNVYITTAPVEVGTAMIGVAKYEAGAQPVESVIVSGNIITAPATITAANICADAIRITNVGHGGTNPESVSVVDNVISNVGEAGISLTGNMAPLVRGNKIVGTVIGIELAGDRMPWIQGNHIVVQQNNGAQIRGLNSTSWPIIYDNYGAGYIDGFAGKPTVSASGSTAAQWPLAGKSGYVTTANATPEIVFAYGSGWANGDTVNVNGTTLTYGTDFTTAATLISAIEALANFVCADYGAPWSITTNHLRVRWSTTSNTAGLFYILVTAASPLAGVILMNDAVSGDRAKSRGEGPTTDVVIWSPCYKLHAPPVLTPENAAAQTAMSVTPISSFRAAISAAVLAADSTGTLANFEATLITAIDAITLPGAGAPLRSTTNAADEQASCTMKIAGLAGTEQFTWRL